MIQLCLLVVTLKTDRIEKNFFNGILAQQGNVQPLLKVGRKTGFTRRADPRSKSDSLQCLRFFCQQAQNAKRHGILL